MCTLVDAVISGPAPDEARVRRLLDEARGDFRQSEDGRGLAELAALEDRLDRIAAAPKTALGPG